MKLKNFPLVLFFVLTITVFRNWFIGNAVNSGDFTLSVSNPTLNAFAWGNGLSGLGGPMYAYGWLNFIIGFPLFLGNLLKINLELIQKIAFFYSFIVLSIISSSFLFKRLFKNNNFYFLTPLIFLFNSYVLMLVGGGQIFIALSIALIPITLYSFINIFAKDNFVKISFYELFRKTLIIGLILTIQIMLDLRIGYVAICSIFLLLLLFNLLNVNKKVFFNTLILFILSLFIVLLLNSYWILPILLVGQNPIEQMGSAYSTSQGVMFFSFAKFENSFSLLHPNWPENIFGKVYFLKPEFLILPILAYLSLFFIKGLKSSKEKLYIIYFLVLGLFGAFLAKGSNEPFGNIYLWLFNHLPGMQMFRDPTKFYALIVLSYSMLIPFSVSKIYVFINSKFKIQNSKLQLKNKKILPNLFLLLVIFYLMFLICPAILGQLTGTFKPGSIPLEYDKLNNFISSKDQFFRTFWVPTTQRFAMGTNRHPSISSSQLFNTSSSSALFMSLDKKETENLLRESAVKYVIVPYDSEGEIFLEDRVYSEVEYLKTVNEINKIAWLRPAEGFGKIKVFEVSDPKDHFWLVGQGNVEYEYVSPVKYEVSLENVQKNTYLIFSESFDKNWSFIAGDSKIMSDKYKLFNSFKLNKDGTYSATVYYEPQKYVDTGLILSGITLASILFFLGFGYVTKKW